jgi:hypothetical protein
VAVDLLDRAVLVPDLPLARRPRQPQHRTPRAREPGTSNPKDGMGEMKPSPKLKALLQQAFAAGEQAQIDAYWEGNWTDFDEWYDEIEWSEW